MFSVIVHGRNDSHGYNLHRRVALSLNCIGHLLDGSDELIFVDWNSPDAVPTLPEAIADTFTAAVRARLRILRVRPSVHDRFAKRTHLPVLDPVARNAAIRRADPSNRWILSTTTDMIFVPCGGATSLRESLSDLPQALYHTPRFDVPEYLWESLPRTEPGPAIQTVSDWGRRLRLEEVVTAEPELLFDGPGDFQLFPRTAAESIHGFDESMLFTYHMDSNIARRLAFGLGPPRSVSERLRAFHCDHYRIGTVHHSGTRVENDRRRYVDDVTVADLRAQADSWGLAHDRLEEIRIDRPRSIQVIGAVADAISSLSLPADVVPAHMASDSFNDLRYDVGHVLPFVADALLALPAGVDLALHVASADLLTVLRETWRRGGFAGRLLLAAECAPAVGAAADGLPILAPAALNSAAGAFLFEFPAPDSGRSGAGVALSVDEMERLNGAAQALRSAVSNETARTGAPRRFILINSIHNAAEEIAARWIESTHTPFTSRVRHGFVVREKRRGAVSPDVLASFVARAMNRQAAVPLQEIWHARRVLTDILETGRTIPAPAAAVALLDMPELASELNATPAAWHALRSQILNSRASVRYSASGVPVRRPGLARRWAETKLCDFADWEDMDWVRICEAPVPDGSARERIAWENGHWLNLLDRAGLADGSRSVLVLADGPDRLHALLSTRAARVDVVVPRPVALTNAVFDPRRLRYLTAEGAAAENRLYDVVLMPHHIGLHAGLGGLSGRLAWADLRTALGGLMGFSGEFIVAGGSDKDWPGHRLRSLGGLESIIGSEVGYAPWGDADWTIAPETLDCLAEVGTRQTDRPHLVLEDQNMLHTTAVWALRKVRSTDPVQWRRLTGRLAAPSEPATDLLAAMLPGPPVNPHSPVLSPPVSLREAQVDLLPGSYRLEINAETAAAVASAQPVLGVEIIDRTQHGRTRIDLAAAQLTSACSIQFDIAGQGPQPIAFRLVALAQQGVSVHSVRLYRSG